MSENYLRLTLTSALDIVVFSFNGHDMQTLTQLSDSLHVISRSQAFDQEGVQLSLFWPR
jgi:hypothetical protein